MQDPVKMWYTFHCLPDGEEIEYECENIHGAFTYARLCRGDKPTTRIVLIRIRIGYYITQEVYHWDELWSEYEDENPYKVNPKKGPSSSSDGNS